jgi:hypothetical protein
MVVQLITQYPQINTYAELEFVVQATFPYLPRPMFQAVKHLFFNRWALDYPDIYFAALAERPTFRYKTMFSAPEPPFSMASSANTTPVKKGIKRERRKKYE